MHCTARRGKAPWEREKGGEEMDVPRRCTTGQNNCCCFRCGVPARQHACLVGLCGCFGSKSTEATLLGLRSTCGWVQYQDIFSGRRKDFVDVRTDRRTGARYSNGATHSSYVKFESARRQPLMLAVTPGHPYAQAIHLLDLL
jgi:hypothetical protein